MKTLRSFGIGLLACALVGLLASPLFAADKAVPKPIAVEEVASPGLHPFWSACSIEAGASGRLTVSSTGSASESVGLLAGLGCSYKVPRSGSDGRGVVVGAFGRVGVTLDDWSSAGASVSFDGPASLGARAGWLISDATLLYGLGGYSWAKWGGRASDGLLLGAGVETRLFSSVSIGVEYNWDDLGGRLDAHSVAVSLRHRF